jgi:hypothetical protein
MSERSQPINEHCSPDNGLDLHKAAEQQNIPLRTLSDVQASLTRAKAMDADVSMAKLMLRHGRLTDEARNYVAREYQR